MKKFLISLSAVFLLSINAHAEPEPQIISPTPEFSEIMKIYNQMTPEQRAEVLETAKAVQAELEAKTPAERQQYFKRAKEAMNNIDFKNVDPSKLDTGKKLSLDEIDDYMASKQ